MKDVIENFKKTMASEGVSRNDIITLENTLGEPIITSNINIKHFTTERSNLPILSRASDILDVYIKDYEKTSLTENFSNREVFDIYNQLIRHLHDLTNTVKSLSEVVSDEFITNILNSNYKYTFTNIEGVKQNEVINVFDNKSNLLDFINNEELFYNLLTEDKIQLFQEYKAHKDYFIGEMISEGKASNNWNMGNDISLFLFLNLIINKEIIHYIHTMSFTPTILNGNDLINFLKDSYNYKEYLIETSNELKAQFEYRFKNLSLGKSNYYYFEEIKRMRDIIPNIKLVNNYLKIILKVI